MSRASAHRLLAKLAANDRKKREQELADLQRRRQQFRETCDAITQTIDRLSLQRSRHMGAGVEAAGLTELECAIEEKRMMALFIEQQIAQIQEEEQQVIRLWGEAGVREKVHDDADLKIVRQQRRRQELRAGRQMEDLCATSRRAARIAAEEGYE